MLEAQTRLSRFLPATDHIRERVRAWWDGRAPAVGGDAATVDGPAHEDGTPHAPLPPEQSVLWSPARIDLSQRIWGPEHVAPGGEEQVATLLKPLSLNPSMSVIEIGAGLGAATRMMHKRFGVWPKAFEADENLASAASLLSKAAGLAKKAPVIHSPLDKLEIKANGFDRVILRDVGYVAPDKTDLLRAAAAGLRRRGLMLITDFVLSRPGAETDPLVAAWRAGEPGDSVPWSEDELLAALRTLGLDVRVTEDESAILRHHVLEGWKAFQPTLLTSAPPMPLIMLALQEGERWRRCVAALDGGSLRYNRIIASKP